VRTAEPWDRNREAMCRGPPPPGRVAMIASLSRLTGSSRAPPSITRESLSNEGCSNITPVIGHCSLDLIEHVFAPGCLASGPGGKEETRS
jgi:hypothetical protein